jgi:hypothetical protein
MAAAALVRGEDANWELSQLTSEATWGQRGRKPASAKTVSLAQWSADVRQKSGRRFSETTAAIYRRVWEKYGAVTKQHPPTLSWSEAYERVRGEPTRERIAAVELRKGLKAAAPEARAEALETLHRDAAVPMSVKLEAAKKQIASQPVRVQAQQVKEALRNPEVRQAYEASLPPPPPKPPKQPKVEPPPPMGTEFEYAQVYRRVGLEVDRTSMSLQDSALRDMLGNPNLASVILRAGLRVKLLRLVRVAQQLADLLPEIKGRTPEDLEAVFDVDYEVVPERAALEAPRKELPA